MIRKNYYLILGVDSDATQDEIQRAFRRLAKDLHPDYYGQDSRPFLDLQEAYAVLGNPERRSAYDRGHRPIRPRSGSAKVSAEPFSPGGIQPEPLIPEDQPIHLDDLSLSRSFHTFSPSFEELFDRLWRNYTPSRPEMEPLYGLNVEILITPSQAFRGGRVRLFVPAQLTCPLCAGRGGIGWFECARCHGTGSISGELPVTLEFPPGIVNNHLIQVPLDSFGIENFYLNVVFRVSA
ncbi:MAG: DnaJ domain-containing protein [Candidatus Promineifilaceae bacterium]